MIYRYPQGTETILVWGALLLLDLDLWLLAYRLLVWILGE
jgi:hypothetical protein